MDGFVRKSTSETKEQKAEEWERKREDAGTPIVALPPETAAPRGAPTVEYVLQQFMNDRKAFRIPAARRVLVCQFELPTLQFVLRLAAMPRSLESGCRPKPAGRHACRR
jgi:hypothetical protein